MKNSREWIESRVSDIERFYPMDTLYDAFEHLPEGFRFRSSLITSGDDGYERDIELFGYSDRKEIDGTITVIKDNVIVAKSEVRYNLNGMLEILDATFPREFYLQGGFLFEKIEINKVFLEQLDLRGTYYTANQSYSITYTIQNDVLSQFIGEHRAILDIGGDEYSDDNGYWRYLGISDEKHEKSNYIESFKSLKGESYE